MGITTHQQVSSQFLTEERKGAVAVLRMNRPEKLNAVNLEMARALVHGLLRAADDKTVRTVVLTGAGRAFCAGGDLERLREARNRRRRIGRAPHQRWILVIAKESSPWFVPIRRRGMPAGPCA